MLDLAPGPLRSSLPEWAPEAAMRSPCLLAVPVDQAHTGAGELTRAGCRADGRSTNWATAVRGDGLDDRRGRGLLDPRRHGRLHGQRPRRRPGDALVPGSGLDGPGSGPLFDSPDSPWCVSPRRTLEGCRRLVTAYTLTGPDGTGFIVHPHRPHCSVDEPHVPHPRHRHLHARGPLQPPAGAGRRPRHHRRPRLGHPLGPGAAPRPRRAGPPGRLVVVDAALRGGAVGGVVPCRRPGAAPTGPGGGGG